MDGVRRCLAFALLTKAFHRRDVPTMERGQGTQARIDGEADFFTGIVVVVAAASIAVASASTPPSSSSFPARNNHSTCPTAAFAAGDFGTAEGGLRPQVVVEAPRHVPSADGQLHFLAIQCKDQGFCRLGKCVCVCVMM